MSVCAFNVELRGKKLQGLMMILLFLLLSVIVHIADIKNLTISFVLGLLACTAVILFVASCEDKTARYTEILTRYTMPIFLMHTLFAAPTRAILLKVGITSATVHVALGLGISFVGPIVAAWIMKKTKHLEFFLYPNKAIKATSIRRN